MNPRVILTTSVISGLFGLYVVYALVMNTLIGVQTLETAKPVELPPPEPPRDSQQMAEKYLAPMRSDAWELHARKRVRSGNAYLYFNEWTHCPYRPKDPDNAVEFNPFTMILKRESDRPVTMQSETARIRFARAFNFRQPDAGRPIEGLLQGKVRITGPNGLVIEGRNFVFQEDAHWIYSDEMVEFHYGKHHGTAGRIQLDLTIDPEKVAKQQFAVSDVKQITLFRNVALHLDPDSEQSGTDAEITVTCQGSLVFDTSRNIATLRDNVHVSMPTQPASAGQGPKQYDSLDCDTLKLQFAAKDAGDAELEASPGSEGQKSEDQPFQSGLTLTEIVATAGSVQQPVIFSSQKNALKARMSNFQYDCLDRVAYLTDLNNRVIVIQQQAQILSPQIILTHDEQGEILSVLCEQPGQMHYDDEKTGERSLVAKWQRSMRVRPENSAGLYLIELDDQATVVRPQEQMELTADHIKLWVSGVEPSSGATASGTQPENVMGNGRPENLLALRNVHMKHPMVKGHTDRLEVWFQDIPADQQPVGHDRPAVRKPASARTDVLEVAHKTAPEADQSLFTGLKNTDGKNEPYDVWANLIQVLVYRAEELKNSYVGGIVTTGDVTITQPKTDGTQPLRMRGNRIEVRNRDATNQNQLVHVFGAPARITDAQVSLAGNLLNLDRSANRAWVTGPGVMMRPIHTSLDGKKLEQPELLKVWWKEKMEFDGRTAHFYDRVRTELGTSNIVCQEMKVTLDRRIDFQDDPRTTPRATGREKTDIDRLECLYGVQIDSEKYENGELVEIRQGEFGELIYDRTRDQSTIAGPGRLYLWQQSNGSRVGLSSQNKAAANQPLRVEDSKWEFLQIDFNGNIDGQIDQQITHFKEGVEIVYGPVNQVGQKLNPHELPDKGGWICSEELEIARHEKTATERPWVELRASGNVKLEGHDKEEFRARADTVTFDESKQMYRLRALGDRDTTIWRQRTPGGKPDSASAKAMLYIPSIPVLKLNETSSVDGIID